MKFSKKLIQYLVRVVWINLVLTIILTGCLPSGVRLPESPLLRDLEKKSGMIVIIGADGNIYTADQGGTTLNQVTSDAFTSTETDATQFYQFPTWSLDGTKLAYVRIRGTTTAIIDMTIFTAQPDGSGQKEIFQSSWDFPLYLYWSPDGNNLTFLAMTPTSNDLSLLMIPAEGGDLLRLGQGTPLYWDWSPDNRSIALHAGGDIAPSASDALSLISIGEDVRRVPLPIIPTLFKAPAWSPNSDELLLAVRTVDEQNALILADQDGGLQEVLAVTEGPVAFAWSGDGERIVYLEKDNFFGPYQYGSISLIEKAEPARVIKAGSAVVAFFWSPDGKQVAYFEPLLLAGELEGDEEESSNSFRLNVLDAESGIPRVLVDFVPTPSFADNLALFDQLQRSATLWSPDSQKIVVPSMSSEGEPQILVIDASGALEPRVLSSGTAAYWSWK